MSDFNTLMDHLQKARAIAASLGGVMTNADQLHEMVDDTIDYASEHCFLIQPTLQERREARYEEIRRERILVESAQRILGRPV